MNGPLAAGAAWRQLADMVAELSAVPLAEITPESRLIEDLGLDSLALAELVVVLLEHHHGAATLADRLEDRSWEGVSLGMLIEAGRRPPGGVRMTTSSSWTTSAAVSGPGSA
jgi:acyl carrier protein